jgi:glycerate kinase
VKAHSDVGLVTGGSSSYRVLIAPDKFAGSLSAIEAADAIAAGWRAVAPEDRVTVLPLADGGTGFVDVLHAALGGRLRAVETTDPLGRPAVGHVLVVDSADPDGGCTAYVESAQACGLDLLALEHRDPSRTTSAGLAALLIAAVDFGADRVVVGLGGSGTNDGGAAMLDALGTDVSRLRAVDLVVATDVDNPLLGPTGATAVFGPQKGADDAMRPVLEERLARFADEIAPELADLPGAGAGGGLGFALFALGGRRVSGADLVMQLLDVTAELATSDLVITGEGALDAQSLRGKLPVRIAAGCLEVGVPCVAIAGRVLLGRRQLAAVGFAEAHAIESYAGSVEASMEQGAAALRGLAAQVAVGWHSSSSHSG